LFAIIAGASSLAKYLKNCSLQSIDISANPIGDDGILSIIEGLRDNKTLTNLDVATCELSAKGDSHIRIRNIETLCIHGYYKC